MTISFVPALPPRSQHAEPGDSSPAAAGGCGPAAGEHPGPAPRAHAHLPGTVSLCRAPGALCAGGLGTDLEFFWWGRFFQSKN